MYVHLQYFPKTVNNARKSYMIINSLRPIHTGEILREEYLLPLGLRTCFKSLIHQASVASTHHGNMDGSLAGFSKNFIIFTQTAVSIKPGESPFNNPSTRQQLETFGVV